MNDKHASKKALEILKAATRDARRGGFRLFRTGDEKFVAKETAKLLGAKTVTEQARNARALQHTAEWMIAKHRKGAPIRAFFHRLGVKDRQLVAIERLHAQALATRQRAEPTARKVEAAAGWWPKTVAREAREIAQAPALMKSYADRYANEIEASGGDAKRLRQLIDTLRAAERTKDAATIAEAVIEARKVIEAHDARIELAAGRAEALQQPGSMDREDLREVAADALRERADALEALAEQADRDGDRAKRDALNRALVELRTAAQQLRAARTPAEAEAARKRAAAAAIEAVRAEGGEVAQVNQRTGAKVGRPVMMSPERADELAQIARTCTANLSDRMRRLEEGLRRAAQRGIEPEGADRASGLALLREQLGEAVKQPDSFRIAGAWLAATSAAEREERTVSVADAMFSRSAGNDHDHDRGHEVSR